MPAPVNCCTTCADTEIVNVPGIQGVAGTDGADGDDGVNAYTTTTANFDLPAAAGPVVGTVSVADNSWMAIGQTIFISDGTDWGTFTVLTKVSTTGVTLTWIDAPNDAAGASTIDSGAVVSPGGEPGALSGALPNALTDNTGGTATDTIAAGAGVHTISFYMDAASIADGDLLTTYVPGYKFKILKVDARCAVPVTTGGKASNINLEIGTTNLTGGVVALSGTYAQGAAIAGTAVTGNNTGANTDSISIEASATTTFIEGAFWIIISIQNMDTADAVASLADHINDLITALT